MLAAPSMPFAASLPHSDAHLPAASQSTPSPSRPLRLGTFNIGLGVARKLGRIIARCVVLELDAVALQEIGDPALLSTRLPSYQLIYAPGPSHHQAGVGLLLALPLVPRARRFHRSSTGRLVAAVLELTRGRQLLLASAYMPSGLDHCAAGSDAHRLAHELYLELARWGKDMHEIVVMGDLNETLTQWDRLPQPPLSSRIPAVTGPIAHLVADGFTDVYRHLHRDASASPGFTHILDGARSSRSRIDYIWCKGLPSAAFRAVHIDTALTSLSHHRLLWAGLQLQHTAAPLCSTPLLRLRLPNLRAITSEHKRCFVAHLELSMLQQREDLEALVSDSDQPQDALHALAASITELVRSSAVTCFPMTGGPSRKSGHLQRLQQQRRILTRLLHIAESLVHRSATHCLPSDCLVRCPEWLRLFHQCRSQHPQLQWRSDVWYGGDPLAWIAETRSILNRTRRFINKEVRRMAQADVSAGAIRQLDANPAAAVHRMLQSDALPSQLTSMIDSHGQLTTSAAELEAVLVGHFRNVFACPPPDDPSRADPRPPPAMLLCKDSVNARWWAGLTDPVSEAEVIDTLKDTDLITAPGEDGVATGVWRIALEGSPALRLLVSVLFSRCLELRTFPRVWKTSVIVPLIKDANKERTANNVRPISLQSCLGKLFMKVLAHRLGRILARFPILNPAQRGFVHGGSTTKCIDELLDAWDHSRAHRTELYSLFYDIKQAYDSVQRDVLIRAMRRLRMPESFVSLIEDSMTGLSSCVRTAFAVSPHFPVERSLRQGCPLAPLLFVILMDALHDGLECNPFTGERAGLTLNLADGGPNVYLPSQGFADDTSVHANTLANLCVLNDWVHYFMGFNRMLLNASKCELVGRGPDGLPVTEAAVAAANFKVADRVLVPVDHATPIRYLGVHCRFDGNWEAQHSRILRMISLFTRMVGKFGLTVGQASYVYNTFLLPKLDLGLRYICGAQANGWVKSYDALLVGSIKHVVASPLRLSHSAVALTARFALPSWLEVAIKASELFIRMNSTGCRWGLLGRRLMRQALQVGAVAEPLPDRRRPSTSSSRLARAVALAVNELQWKLQLRDEPTRRRLHLFGQALAGPLPDTITESSCASPILLSSSPPVSTRVVHDCWTGWGPTLAPRTVHVYTDGSYGSSPPENNQALPASSSAWAVTVCDEWLSSNFALLPTDEQLLTRSDVGEAVQFGAAITCTSGVYAAELQAIARALAMFSASCTLHIHSDSQGALAGIRAYMHECNARRRLRMSARPLLQLIAHLIAVRERAGGTVYWHHVKAHSQNSDIDSVGNRLTDWQANRARAHPRVPQPVHLRELPLSECEHFLTVWQRSGTRRQQQLFDDPRRCALAHLRTTAATKWSLRQDSAQHVVHDGTLFGSGMLDLSRVVLASGSPTQQATLLHIATNSIQCVWTTAADNSQCVRPISCPDCPDLTCALSHMAGCAGAHATRFRSDLRSDILAVLHASAHTADWCHRYGGGDLQQILMRLFPISSTVSGEEQRQHFARSFCGAFSARHANAAAKQLGFPSAEDGRLTLQRIRFACLDRIAQVYSDLKKVAAS